MTRFGSSVLGCLFAATLLIAGCSAIAQTIGAESPAQAPADPIAKQNPPPGSCMPIGITVSGEIVFPFQCKEFIEQQKAVSRKPAGTAASADAAEKPSVEEETPAASNQKASSSQPVENPQPENITTSGIEVGPTEAKTTAPEPAENSPSKRSEPKHRLGNGGSANCTHYRTYDSASGTYRDFRGRRRSCPS
jgi:hypothetical protein